ncbi:MAG: OmpH family outer membrane protein [Balneolaceae bacterium]
MIKRILIAASIALFVGQFAVAQTKIGYANPDVIMSQLPEVQKISAEIQKFLDEKDAMLRPKADSLQILFDEYEKVMAALSDEARQRREQELMAKNAEFEELKRVSLEEVQLRQNALIEPMQEKVTNAIAAVAKELGLDLVLSDRTSQGSEIIFYAASNQPNITEKVINKLKQ